MDQFEMIRSQMGAMVPFANHAGAEVTKLGLGVGEVQLQQTATSVNHIGSQHAGALFTAGETASGAAMIGLFLDRLAEVTPVAASAQINFKKVAKGTITAKAQLDAEAETLLAGLEADGKVAFDVAVSLQDEGGEEVATMQVGWHVRKNG